MGDVVTRPENNHLHVSVEVSRGKGCTLELHTAAGCVERQPIREDECRFELALAVDTYVRAQLVGTDNQTRAVSNPIYVR